MASVARKAVRAEAALNQITRWCGAGAVARLAFAGVISDLGVKDER